ncbi:hypothetical protein KI387_003353, partial [Taxus chinensis]
RQVVVLAAMITQRGNQGGDDINEEEVCEEEETQALLLDFEQRVLLALEGKNDGIRVDVSKYGGSLKQEELIDWLSSMGNFFEWKA